MPSKSKKAVTPATLAGKSPMSNPIKAAPEPADTLHKHASAPSPPVNGINGRHMQSRSEQGSRTGDTTESAGEATLAPTVNRKKQKRREKEAAKRAAEQQMVNGHGTHDDEYLPPPPGRGPAKGYFTEEPDYVDPGYAEAGASPEDAFYSGEDDQYDDDEAGGPENSWLNTSKRKKGTKRRSLPPLQSTLARRNLPTLSNAAIRTAHKMSNDHIWNTSTQAERENIKQFWLELGEEDRRSLVKVEKEAVLRKMKEQQKHSCSCSVCGRKRTAIEEELEVLYDAYYEELEQFANHNNDISTAPQLMASSRAYRQLRGPAHSMAGAYPSRSRVQELGDDDEELDEDEEYEEDDEPYSDEELEEDILPPGPPDFFQFGQSLTVKGIV